MKCQIKILQFLYIVEVEKKAKIGCEYLKELGYDNVYDMGGIMDWPYEIES